MNLFLLDLVKDLDDLNIIPENIEKFKAVFTEKYTFLDSYAFLSSSLEKLSKNLQQSGYDKFKRLKLEFLEHYKLLADKGVYFYDYADSFSVFAEIFLPPKEAFYNQMREEHISELDYSRAKMF